MAHKLKKVMVEVSFIVRGGQAALQLVCRRIHYNTELRLFSRFDAGYDGNGVIHELLPSPVDGKLTWKTCAFIVPLSHGSLPTGRFVPVEAELEFFITRDGEKVAKLICRNLTHTVEARLIEGLGAVSAVADDLEPDDVTHELGNKTPHGRRTSTFTVPLPPPTASAA